MNRTAVLFLSKAHNNHIYQTCSQIINQSNFKDYIYVIGYTKDKELDVKICKQMFAQYLDKITFQKLNNLSYIELLKNINLNKYNTFILLTDKSLFSTDCFRVLVNKFNENKDDSGCVLFSPEYSVDQYQNIIGHNNVTSSVLKILVCDSRLVNKCIRQNYELNAPDNTPIVPIKDILEISYVDSEYVFINNDSICLAWINAQGTDGMKDSYIFIYKKTNKVFHINNEIVGNALFDNNNLIVNWIIGDSVLNHKYVLKIDNNNNQFFVIN
jgi:hypothetical protein